MNNLIYVSIFSLSIGLFTACETKTTGGSMGASADSLALLKSENKILEAQLIERDSVLNESFALFNEIESNLAMINLKEDEIRYKTKDTELSEDGKQWILQEIQNINHLRESNQKKVRSLTKQLRRSEAKRKDGDTKISELEKMIANLANRIEIQDQEIEILRTELSDLDKEYVELLEAYEEQTMIAAETMVELNKAYYAYGTFKELENNGVLVKEGGFVGIGKRTELKDNINDEYFTEIDINQVTEIDIDGGKKIKFISDHPSDSYSLNSKGKSHKLTIKDSKSFWKVSKYLVVVVE